jgi:purine-nucleoside phosphorylase
MKEKIEASVRFLKEKGIDNVELGIVLGTGLDGLAADIERVQDIPYSSIPHFAMAY